MSLDVNTSEPDEFNCVELHEIIQDVAKLRNVKDFDYHVDFLTGKGDNYVAHLFRLTITEIDKPDTVNIKVIVKTLINTSRQELFHELHKREVFVYREVIPRFQKILKEYYVNKNFKLAECYMSSAERGKEVIILEDLVEGGYQMDQNKFQSVDYEHASLIFRKLAKFHALSFVMHDKDPSTFDSLKANCKDLIFDDSFISKLKDYFVDSFNISIKAIIDDESRNKMYKVAISLVHRMKEYVKPRKYSVLCHGDFWINNILFKREEEKPIDVLFLDFQAMRYASPMTDIMYFTYLCTDAEFRTQHYDDLLNLYYDTLKTILNECSIDANIVYPREAFDADIEEFTIYGLLCAMIELRILTIESDDEKYLDELQVGQDIDSVIGELRLYALRINETVNELSKKGYLDNL